MSDGRTTRDKSTYYFKNLTGKRFGKLVVMEKVGSNKWGNVLWKCICDCGNIKTYPSGKLTSGSSNNCGCITSEIRRQKASKHGITAGGKPRTLVIWNGMKARCFNPKSTSYKNYGGRGITICEEWLVFENFHNWAITNGYADDLQIDRINNNGNYCPENCRWVKREENMRNCSYNHFVEIMGVRKTVSEWIKELGISKSVAYRHLNISDDNFVNYVLSVRKNKFIGGITGERIQT